MSMMDNLEGNLDGIAAKVGLSPDQVKAIVTALQSKITSGDQSGAVEATARQFGVQEEKVQQILASVAGGGSLMDQAKNFDKRLFGSNPQ